MSYRASQLPAGDRLWLDRRARQETILQAAKRYGVSEYTYKLWEKGISMSDQTPVPWVHIPSPLSNADKAALARRRAGWRIKDLCRVTGLSHVTVIKWERPGVEGPNPLVDYWTEHGWP